MHCGAVRVGTSAPHHTVHITFFLLVRIPRFKLVACLWQARDPERSASHTYIKILYYSVFITYIQIINELTSLRALRSLRPTVQRDHSVSVGVLVNLNNSPCHPRVQQTNIDVTDHFHLEVLNTQSEHENLVPFSQTITPLSRTAFDLSRGTRVSIDRNRTSSPPMKPVLGYA